MLAVDKLSDNEKETADARTFIANYNQYLDYFENRLLPALVAGANQATIKAMDKEIDTLCK